ncbi:MAG: hypothetical protein RR946_10815 [Clostridia bacterium]
MAQEVFCYSFRFCCDPGFHEEAELDALHRFVQEAHIDDVMVFANVQEINTGHMTFAEQDGYLALMRRVRDTLSDTGATLSMNHWHSLMHGDGGKKLKQGQAFRLMVDPVGRESSLCCCPRGEEWQAYLCGLYARYAALGPNVLWVEDDFRFHNHEPLLWGGCFCDDCMRHFSEMAGEPLTRERFVRGVLASGEVHPYRKIWLDSCRETLIAVAARLERAVHAVCAQTRLGLMSSTPFAHAAEGRDWMRLMHAFAGDKRPVSRIHLPGYTESAPWEYQKNFNMVSMCNRAFLPPETQVYPELENFPYSRYVKSRRFTRFQLLSAVPLDLAGMTIDLFDLNGNGIVWEEGYEHVLSGAKPFLNRITELGVMGWRKCGVCVLVSQDAAYTLHTAQGCSMEELYPQEVFFAGLLPAMGVPFYMETNAELTGEIVAVSGQYLRCLNVERVRALFENNVLLLTGDAVETLLSMGLGALAGIIGAEWLKQDSGAYTYEQAEDEERYAGRAQGRASLTLLGSDVLNVRYEESASVRVLSGMYDSYRKRVCHAQAMVNERVFIYPFGHFEHPLEIPRMLLTTLRRDLLVHTLQKTGRVKYPIVSGAPYVEPYVTRHAGKEALYLVNASLDDAQEMRLTNLPAGHAHAVPSNAPECDIELKVGEPLALVLPAMESLLIVYDEGGEGQ